MRDAAPLIAACSLLFATLGAGCSRKADPLAEWSGRYPGGTLCSGETIELGADLSFVHERFSGMPLYSSATRGRIVARDGWFEFVVPQGQFTHLAGDGLRLFPLRWGTQRFLLSSDDLLQLCNDVNNYGKPHSAFFRREGDPDSAFEGLPSLPQEFARYLLPAALGARATEAHEDIDPELPNPRWSVALDLDREAGSFLGMCLHAVEPQVAGELILVELRGRSARGFWSPRVSDDSSVPQPGWRFSTKP